MKRTFLLRCPKCGHSMKYATDSSIVKKNKKCVYCGKNIVVEKNILKRI